MLIKDLRYAKYRASYQKLVASHPSPLKMWQWWWTFNLKELAKYKIENKQENNYNVIVSSERKNEYLPVEILK